MLTPYATTRLWAVLDQSLLTSALVTVPHRNLSKKKAAAPLPSNPPNSPMGLASVTSTGRQGGSGGCSGNVCKEVGSVRHSSSSKTQEAAVWEHSIP